MIGWPVGFQSGIHDHPNGGCLAKNVKGPGILETNYWKSKNRPYQKRKARQGNRTKLYKCIQVVHGKNTRGCDLKNQTLAWITELYTEHVDSMSSKLMHQQGYDYMHSVKNPHKEATLTLHFYFGDYRISYWKNEFEDSGYKFRSFEML